MTATALEMETLQRQFFLTGDAAEVLRATTERVDSIIRAAFATHLAPAFPKGLAALAVGRLRTVRTVPPFRRRPDAAGKR